MKPEDLREKNSESYDKWFERWYKKENLPKKLEKSAMQGYMSSSYRLNDSYTDYERRRLDDERFLAKLKEKLPGFNIYKNESKRFERILFGKNFGYGWTDPKIIISWKKVEE